ncbi:uncharacterized protein GGS22DRAFT_161643 [Annulohypoxylon maeteangense]|uniref:uncharacterized protein n=1 Tax=Annulohypoxylon maeteangense TaxID=1927788 RepID=UPI0020082F5D|nr:uncharacterized protein GGS22DRAFT_161643 [Annulohypoxylon maeteangense]KAI0885696.1 hypothetical protein GGS22DRAFT_161643 [Annulohypoxylon maeteangense]
MTVFGSSSKSNRGCDSPTKRKRADTDPILSNKRPRPENSPNPSSTEDARILQAVESKYDVRTHSIISSSKIQKKVTAILQHLASPATKTTVSILRSKASDAGKLVSIAEIAKRELREQAGNECVWFQYVAIGEELKEIPRDEGNTIIEETRLGNDDFEVMKTPFERAIEGQPRLRGVPVISLFLCRVSIEELKKRYGEQTNTSST